MKDWAGAIAIEQVGFDDALIGILSSEQFAQFVRTELQNWRKVVVENSIKVD